jgi:hypothetical protein
MPDGFRRDGDAFVTADGRAVFYLTARDAAPMDSLQERVANARNVIAKVLTDNGFAVRPAAADEIVVQPRVGVAMACSVGADARSSDRVLGCALARPERDGVVSDFAVDTWWPQAVLVDLETATLGDAYSAARDDGEARHAFVTITRHRARLFDGIDFEIAGEPEITGRVIDNLVVGADVTVELWDPGSPD